MWTIELFLKHLNKLPPDAQKTWLQVKKQLRNIIPRWRSRTLNRVNTQPSSDC
jgi:hypothetical protein